MEVLNQCANLIAKYPDAKVVVTGHSLGAAMAALAALDIHPSIHIDIYYNFGQPRVGDFNWSAYFD